MKGKLFTIGELARIMGMTVKALRFYERIGLLEPHYIDPRTKYRYYSSAQLMRLDIIKAARSMGMSMKEINHVLGEKDGQALISSLAKQGERVAEKIEELRRMAASIEAARAAIADSLSSVGERGVYVKIIPERRIVSVKIGLSPSVEEVAVGYSVLNRLIGERKLVNRYETGILLTPDEESRFQASQVINTVGIAADSDPSGLSSLPAGSYLCVRYDEKSAVAQQAKLRAYMRRRKVKPALMLQADALSDLLSPEAAQVELQVAAS